MIIVIINLTMSHFEKKMKQKSIFNWIFSSAKPSPTPLTGELCRWILGEDPLILSAVFRPSQPEGQLERGVRLSNQMSNDATD